MKCLRFCSDMDVRMDFIFTEAQTPFYFAASVSLGQWHTQKKIDEQMKTMRNSEYESERCPQAVRDDWQGVLPQLCHGFARSSC